MDSTPLTARAIVLLFQQFTIQVFKIGTEYKRELYLKKFINWHDHVC